MPDSQHFILGGKARGEPLPTDREIFTVHFRQWPLLKELGRSGPAKAMLEKHTGLKKVTIVMKHSSDPAIAKAARLTAKPERLEKKAQRAALKVASPDEKKAARTTRRTIAAG